MCLLNNTKSLYQTSSLNLVPAQLTYCKENIILKQEKNFHIIDIIQVKYYLLTQYNITGC